MAVDFSPKNHREIFNIYIQKFLIVKDVDKQEPFDKSHTTQILAYSRYGERRLGYRRHQRGSQTCS